MPPQDEAAHILDQVLVQLMSPTRDIVAVMRSLQHACELLGWSTQQAWFQRELAGYGLETAVPAYRKVPCRLAWHPKGSARENTRWITEEVFHGDSASGDAHSVRETEQFELRMGIDALVKHSHSSLIEDTSETRLGYLSEPRASVPLQRVKVVDAESFRAVLVHIENIVFDFASKNVVRLKYGNTMGDIWSEYRATLDKTISQLPFSNHLAAIDDGLRSTNPESWRSAVYACRSLLSDVAGYLWKDPRSTYDGLPAGDGKAGRLDVSGDKYANKYRAYLHVKSVTGTRGKFLSEDAAYLGTVIHSLIGFQCEAHQPISQQDSSTM